MPGRGYGGACCFTWTGLYVGAHIGKAWDHVEWADVSLTGERVKNDDRGFIGGGQIGYNLQAGNIVFGIEATLSRTNLSDDFPSVIPGITFGTDVNWTGSVVGRLGFAHDRFLVYARGGWATANISCPATTQTFLTPSPAMTNVMAGSSVAVSNTRSAAT